MTRLARSKAPTWILIGFSEFVGRNHELEQWKQVLTLETGPQFQFGIGNPAEDRVAVFSANIGALDARLDV